MWEIFEKKSLLKVIRKLPIAVVEHYELWKRIIELEGPSGLRKIKGLHDEALKGEWRGARSSRLTRQWRIIYSVEQVSLAVYVIDINPHNYKRRH